MTDSTDARLTVALAEIERLRDIIAELEARAAIACGSLAPAPAPDKPAVIIHDVPPNAPR